MASVQLLAGAYNEVMSEISDDIIKYNQSIIDNNLFQICDKLTEIINNKLKNSTNKIWHGSPVWFISKDPIVGFDLRKNNTVNLMFWSGQAFSQSGLSPGGKFKAAEIKHSSIQDINQKQLEIWISEASQKIYNYGDIRKNLGKLTLLDKSELR